MLTRAQLTEVSDTMRRMFPDAHCELTHRNPFELVVAVALSAQATDALVNKVTPGLFEAYPSVESMAAADVADIEALIKRIGLYRNKAKNVKALSMQIVERHDGIVPSDRESLEALPGVGRKTANVVLSVAFHEPAFAVDTHVERVSKRHGHQSDCPADGQDIGQQPGEYSPERIATVAPKTIDAHPRGAPRRFGDVTD